MVYGQYHDGIWSSSIPYLSFLISENIFRKCFRSSSSLTNPRISPLTIEYECPQLSILFTTCGTQTHKVGHESCDIIPCLCLHHKRMPETLKFSQSKGSNAAPHNEVQIQSSEKDAQGHSDAHPQGRTDCPRQKSNYELFERNNFNIRLCSWNYRGCWHQTCPPIDTREGIWNFTHSSYKTWMPCIVISCHYLLVSGLGNLCACCLP